MMKLDVDKLKSLHNMGGTNTRVVRMGHLTQYLRKENDDDDSKLINIDLGPKQLTTQQRKRMEYNRAQAFKRQHKNQSKGKPITE